MYCTSDSGGLRRYLASLMNTVKGTGSSENTWSSEPKLGVSRLLRSRSPRLLVPPYLLWLLGAPAELAGLSATG